MTTLLANIDFSVGGNGDSCVLGGWAEPEVDHRWTFGQESQMVLPVAEPGPGCILVMSVTPYVNPPGLPAQVVMLALNGRLLATVRLARLEIMSFPFPPGLERAQEIVLSISHLSVGQSRAVEQTRQGEPLGLMFHSLRVFRVPEERKDQIDAASQPGLLPGPLLRNEVERRTGLSVQALATRFESIGQGCQFGLVQRQCGAEPLGLLRFVDTVTSKLVDGLVALFAGIDNADRLEMVLTADAQPRLAWRQLDFGLTYDTGLLAAGCDRDQVHQQQARRLGFLRRKFAEDLASGNKICVLTRGDCLTRSEALAVWCALRLHGPVTLLWNGFGDAASSGRVDRLAPGFLRGELGMVDSHAYGSMDAWLSIMANAFAMQP